MRPLDGAPTPALTGDRATVELMKGEWVTCEGEPL